MIGWIKKYWLEILVFAGIFTILMIDLNPNFTFMNKSLDSLDYIYAAKYFYVAHQLSYPLYLLIGHIFLMLPFGTESWRMGLISVLSSVGTCIFLYLIVKRLLSSRWYALLAVLIFGMSALVISQSIIVETYSLLTMFATGAYYFAIKKQWKRMAIMVSLGLAVHILMGIVFVIALFIKEFRSNKVAILISLVGILFYIYLPLRSGATPDLVANQGTTNIITSFLNAVTVINYFMGTLSIYELPKRIFDTIGVLGVSMGILAIFPIVIYFWHRKFYKSILFWLCLIPIIIFISELDMQTYDYMMMAIPFLAIAACFGLKILRDRYNWAKCFTYSMVVIIVGFGLFNANYFDIGRTLDKNMYVTQLYQSYSEMPTNAVLLGNNNYQMVNLYNKEHDTHIVQVEVGKLTQVSYRYRLVGVAYLPSNSSMDVARSIVQLNNNVWIQVEVNPNEYQFQIVEANHNVSLLNQLDNTISEKASWQFKPYNPYDILTTRIYLNDWLVAIMSKYNFRLLCIAIIFIIVANKFAFPNKKREIVTK